MVDFFFDVHKNLYTKKNSNVNIFSNIHNSQTVNLIVLCVVKKRTYWKGVYVNTVQYAKYTPKYIKWQHKTEFHSRNIK